MSWCLVPAQPIAELVEDDAAVPTEDIVVQVGPACAAIGCLRPGPFIDSSPQWTCHTSSSRQEVDPITETSSEQTGGWDD